MQKTPRRNGWHNYSLFMRPDGLVFGYFETEESSEAALAGMEEEAVSALAGGDGAARGLPTGLSREHGLN